MQSHHIQPYEGETARSARTRGAEHMRDFKKGKVDSAMNNHKQNEHNGEDIKYRMEITKSCQTLPNVQ